MIQTSLKTTGIDHVVLWVNDLERSKRFYKDFLGMTVAHENERQCFLWCGTQQIALFPARDGGRVTGSSELNHMALKLEAGEYEEVKARLESEGFEVSGRPGDDRCIYFNDPDGHRLQLLTPAEQH